MGVKDLWKILEPARTAVKVEELCGFTLSIDLSAWVCEAECVAEMKGRVLKPYLRFRILYFVVILKR